MAERFGRYLLERKLATGGMAEIFLARQEGPSGFERVCVVKRILPHLAEDPQFAEMFLDEARVSAQLSHPNIAQIYDFGSHQNVYFIAMEYAAGCDLGSLLRLHRSRQEFVPLPLVARIVSLAASALDHAHQAVSPSGQHLLVIHRDVSPSNILVTRAGQIKLIDFGVAKAATTRQKTRTGVLKGKFAYMSPEQVRGLELDGRSDLFSLGLVLFELLTNAPAIAGASDVDLLRNLMEGRMRSVEELRPDLLEPLRAVMEKARHPDRDLRYATGAELSAALEGVIRDAGWTVTPADLGALATLARPEEPSEARTEARSPTPTVSATLVPAETAIAPDALRGRARWPWFAVPLGIALAGGTALSLRALWSEPPPAAPPVPAPRVTAPPPAPAPAPPPQAQAPPARVRIHIASEPSGAGVYEGEALIGNTPLDLLWERGRNARLQFVLPGYAPEVRVIAPQTDLFLPVVKLARSARPEKHDRPPHRTDHPTPDLKDAPY